MKARLLALVCLAFALAAIFGGASSARAAGSVSIRPVCGAVPLGYARCFSLVRGNSTAAGPTGYAPADLQSAYKLPSPPAGAGQPVAIVDAFDDPTAESDLAQYRSFYGLPPCTTANGCFRKVNQNGGTLPMPAPSPDWALEISLDLDMVSAVCPNCHILLVESNTNLSSDLYVAKQSWQTDTGCSRRTVADVSAVADPNTGVAVLYSGVWFTVGGTRASSPIIASVYALAGNASSVTYVSDPYSHTSGLFDV